MTKNQNDLQILISGIKCDNKECDYRDDSVQFEDYPKWLNKPCPQCESNLLTVEDMETLLTTIKVAKFVDKWTPKFLKKGPKAQMNVELDGTGKAKFDVEKIEK